jgi:hypothetical protein
VKPERLHESSRDPGNYVGGRAVFEEINLASNNSPSDVPVWRFLENRLGDGVAVICE